MENFLRPSALIQSGSPSAKEIADCNALTAAYGLSLSAADVQSLRHAHREALHQSGRVEFEDNVIPKLIAVFCDSPFLSQTDYASTLCALTGIFYHFKTDMLDTLDDDDLIALMRRLFDNPCYGSNDLLYRELDTLARHIRSGISGTDPAGEDDEEDGHDEQG